MIPEYTSRTVRAVLSLVRSVEFVERNCCRLEKSGICERFFIKGLHARMHEQEKRQPPVGRAASFSSCGVFQTSIGLDESASSEMEENLAS
mgnify:FL=1